MNEPSQSPQHAPDRSELAPAQGGLSGAMEDCNATSGARNEIWSAPHRRDEAGLQQDARSEPHEQLPQGLEAQSIDQIDAVHGDTLMQPDTGEAIKGSRPEHADSREYPEKQRHKSTEHADSRGQQAEASEAPLKGTAESARLSAVETDHGGAQPKELSNINHSTQQVPLCLLRKSHLQLLGAPSCNCMPEDSAGCMRASKAHQSHLRL